MEIEVIAEKLRQLDIKTDLTDFFLSRFVHSNSVIMSCVAERSFISKRNNNSKNNNNKINCWHRASELRPPLATCG